MSQSVYISLPESLKEWIDSRLARDGYGNVSELVEELIRREQKREAFERLEDRLEKIIDNDPLIEVTDAYWESLRAEGARWNGPETGIMTLRIVIRATVHDELLEYFDFIALDKMLPAEAFLDAVYESFQRLAQLPYIGRRLGSSRPRLANLRVYPIPPPYRSYLVIYRVEAQNIEILSVVHGMRDIEAILDRIL